MSDKEKLTIEQKIEIARLAAEIYLVEYPSGHSGIQPAQGRTSPETRSQQELLVARQKRKEEEIAASFSPIYQMLKNIVIGDPDNN